MQGLVCPELQAVPGSIQEFLTEYRFDSPTDEENCGSGITPLMIAVLSGNSFVVNELITQHKVNVNACTKHKIPELGALKGATAMHFVGYCPREETYTVVTALLAAGADVNAATAEGVPVLMASAVFLNEIAVDSIIKASSAHLNIEKSLPLNHASILNVACYQTTTEIVEILLKAGADRAHVNDHGGCPIFDTVQNHSGSPPMLELLFAPPPNQARSVIDVNRQAKPRTTKWMMIDILFRAIVRSGISNSGLALDVAHSEGSTVSDCNGILRTSRFLAFGVAILILHVAPGAAPRRCER